MLRTEEAEREREDEGKREQQENTVVPRGGLFTARRPAEGDLSTPGARPGLAGTRALREKRNVSTGLERDHGVWRSGEVDPGRMRPKRRR